MIKWSKTVKKPSTLQSLCPEKKLGTIKALLGLETNGDHSIPYQDKTTNL